MDADVKARVDALYRELEVSSPRATRGRGAAAVAAIDSVRSSAPQAAAAEQRQREPDQRGRDRARRLAALGRRRRRDDAARGVPREQRLHPLQVRLRDEPRLAFGEVGAWSWRRRHVHRAREGGAILVELGDAWRRTASATCSRSPARRHSSSAPASAKNTAHADDRREAVRVPEARRPPRRPRRTARTGGSRPRPASAPAGGRRARAPPCTRRAASSRRVRVRPSSASARRASVPRSVPPPASRSGASLMDAGCVPASL